jgi:hypothetical protein
MQLNLPEIELKTRINSEDRTEVFDVFRKKYVVLTPEEWVRQHFLHFLVDQKKYPVSLIGVEKGLNINQMKKRFDAVIFNTQGIPTMLLEFKSPKVSLNQKTFNQVSTYNLKMKVEYLLISNGLKHYCCRMNYEANTFHFLKEIPTFNELTFK